MTEITLTYRRDRHVWTLEDEGGIPDVTTPGGRRAMPFWSSRSRIETLIATVPAYAGFQPRELALENFVRDGLTGRNPTAYWSESTGAASAPPATTQNPTTSGNG